MYTILGQLQTMELIVYYIMYYNSRCIAKCFIAVRGLFQIPAYTATEIGVLLDYAKLNDVYMYLK